MVGGVTYSTAVQDLKSKIWKASRLNPSKYEIQMHHDGRELTKEHCFLAHYGIAGRSTIEVDFIDKDKDSQRSLYSKDVGDILSDGLMSQEIPIRSRRPWRKCCTFSTNAIEKLNALRVLLLEMALASRRHKVRAQGHDAPAFRSPGSMGSWTAVMGEEELGHFGYLLEKVAKQFLQGETPHDEVFHIITVTDVWSFNIYLNVGGAISCLPMRVSKNKSRCA